jgi:hypothetical protein
VSRQRAGLATSQRRSWASSIPHITEERLLDGSARSVAPFIDALEECDCGWAAEREDGGNSGRCAQEDGEMVHTKIREGH